MKNTEVGYADSDRKFEVKLNIESQRKTPTAISFATKTRTYGDAAVHSQNRNMLGAFSYFKNLLGRSMENCEHHGVDDYATKCVESAFGMKADYYQNYELKKNETRGVWEVVVDKKTGRRIFLIPHLLH